MTASPTLIGYLDKRLGKHQGRGPEYKWYCPACVDRIGTESSSQRLHVNVDRNMGHCFRCGYAFRSLESLFRFINNGSLRIEEARLIRKTTGVTEKGLVADIKGVFARSETAKRSRLLPEELPKEMLPLLAAPPYPECASAMRYLLKRGVTREMIRRHDVHFCPEGDYRGYLVFPITLDHEVVYFTTRYAGNNARRKSKNPTKAEGKHSKATCLLNYDGVVGNEVVAVVEGPFDMMAFDGCAVGIMGKEISSEQVSLIEELVPHGLREVVVALDPDAGIEMEATFNALKSRIPTVSAMLLDGGDPWDSRDSLPDLLDRRVRELSVTTSVRARMKTGSFVRRKFLSNGFPRDRRGSKQVLL